MPSKPDLMTWWSASKTGKAMRVFVVLWCCLFLLSLCAGCSSLPKDSSTQIQTEDLVQIPDPQQIQTLDDYMVHSAIWLEGLGVCNARLNALNEKIEASKKD